MKTIRKGAIVRYTGKDTKNIKMFSSDLCFKVYQKEGNTVKLESLEKPYFGICAVTSINNVELV